MKFANLECVVLKRDIPESGLRSGDIGTVVEVYPGGGLEIEFVRASGETQALVTLTVRDVRKIGYRDMLSARELEEVK